MSTITDQWREDLESGNTDQVIEGFWEAIEKVEMLESEIRDRRDDQRTELALIGVLGVIVGVLVTVALLGGGLG